MKQLAIPIPQFCNAVGCERSTAYNLIRRGEVIAVKLGRKTVVTVASIEAMLERNAVGQSVEQKDAVPHDGSTPTKVSGDRRATMCRLACNDAKQARRKAAKAGPWRG